MERSCTCVSKMYLLRSPITKTSICKVIPSSRVDGFSSVVCPLCRGSQIFSAIVQTYRLQSTNTKTSIVRLQLKKKKKKTKTEEYSDLIQVFPVAETSGNNIKESRAIIKKSSTNEILKTLGAPRLVNACKQVSELVTSTDDVSPGIKADWVNRNNSPATGAISSLSKCSKPASHLSPAKHANAAKSVKTLSKKKSSSRKDSAVKSRQSPQPKSVEINASVCNTNDAISDKFNYETFDNHFSTTNSYNMETIRIPRLEPISQGFDDENAIFFPNQKLDNDELDEFHKMILSKNNKLTDKDRSFQRKKSLTPPEREMSSKIKKKDLDKSGKDLHLNLSLGAFLDVCVNSDMLNQAHGLLMCYRVKGKYLKNASQLTDVGLFNIVLTGHAQKGNWSKVKELLIALRCEKIKPNLQTYAGCLECISRLITQDKQLIRSLLQEAEKHHLDIAMIDQECTFVNDQRERVIEVIRLVQPDFQPSGRANLTHYSCNLLSRLNEEPPKDRFYNPSGGIVTYEQLLANLKDQLEMEVSDKVVVQTIEKSAYQVDKNLAKLRRIRRECEENWRAALLRAFEKNVRTLSSHQVTKYGKSVTLQPFLTTLDTKVYVDIMLNEIQLLGESSEAFSLPLSTLHVIIGSKVMNSYARAMKQKHGLVGKIESLYRKYCKYYLNTQLTSRYTPREYWQKILSENMEGPSLDIDNKIWPGYLLAGIGRFLYDMIIKEVKINRNLLKSEAAQGCQLPAFYSIYRKSGVFATEEIKTHPILVHMYQSDTKETLTFEGTVVPSLVPPLPWTSIRSGGYLLSSVQLIRQPDTVTHQKLKLEQTPNQQLFPIYDSLNQLGECPWKINKPVLDIIIDVFNHKGNQTLAIPPPSSECPPLPQIGLDKSREERAKAYRERECLKRKRVEMHSLRCDGLYKLSIANHFRDKIFWFPHNLDFRGRVYPCPPHFNHLGGDMTRSILLFAKGEPLGEKGLDWLKVHLINLTGLKKQEAISKRLEYANEMILKIIDSADNPLNGRKWWMKSDEPWQTLACCMEITNAIRSPDPENYICHFPIHQDGSCNGLQHYAALGRDEHGAKQVNLYSTDKPQDVYTGIANLVEKERAKDAKNGVEIAKALEGFIKRKVIKQTVMTTVYGVTRYGARRQIYKQLKDLPDFPEDQAWAASMYLTENAFKSLQQMFTATKEIQDWLTEVARLISQVCGQPVEWVTPLGLPIVQPYFRPAKTLTSLGLGKKPEAGQQFRMDIFLHPNVIKQKNAFPPNFIHSLDSAHMMLTSLFCQREGITFVSVHDCYWTHPSKSIQIMNKICREQFVALHSEPILENLSKFLTQKYSYSQDEFQNDKSVVDMAKERLNTLITCVPATGNFDLRNVLQSMYFFS